MSKSVLVMETPENCKSCIHVGTFRYFCRINCRDITNPNVKPVWCPLRPLPEKKEEEKYWRGEHELSWIQGWNACIDEITGGEVDGEITTKRK